MGNLGQRNSKVLTDIWNTSSLYPCITQDASGQKYVCWQNYKNGHDCVLAGQLSAKEGYVQTTCISGDGEALKPVCAANGKKIWYAWGECKDHIWGIYYRSYENGIYGDIHCAEKGNALFYPYLYTKDDVTYLLWNRQESNAAQVVAAVIGENGLENKEVISCAKEAYRPSFCISDDHTAYVAYDSFNGTNYDIIIRCCKNGRWSEEKVISTTKTAFSSNPQVAALKDQILVCWYDFDHASAFSYHSAVVSTENAELIPGEDVCIAKGIDWYEDVAVSANSKGEAVFAYTWGKYKVHVRRYNTETKWDKPVVLTYDDSNFASDQKVLLDDDGTIHMVWQFGNKNGHKPHRNAMIVYSWADKEEYTQNTDLEAETVSNPFAQPIPEKKSLDRVGKAETKAWMEKNGYKNLFPVFGDIHGQSGMTDGVGEIDQYFNIAKAWGNLDFTALTDHDCYPTWLSQSEWEWIRTTSKLFNVKNQMATLLAYEWTSNEYRYDFGHKNVYYRNFDGELFRSGDEGGMTPDRLFASIKKYQAMAFPHHPSASWKLVSAATDWAFHDESVQRMVEIYSRHAPFEYYGNYSKYTKNNMQIEHCSAQDALALGYHLGFTGGSDSHQMEHGVEGGITVSFVDELTNETIWDNLYDRFMYATTGAGILLSFRADGKEMGQILKRSYGAEIHFTVSVLGTDTSKVEILCNNQVIMEKESNGNACDFEFTGKAGDKEMCYYVRVTQADCHQAWSSPIWIKGE